MRRADGRSACFPPTRRSPRSRRGCSPRAAPLTSPLLGRPVLARPRRSLFSPQGRTRTRTTRRLPHTAPSGCSTAAGRSRACPPCSRANSAPRWDRCCSPSGRCSREPPRAPPRQLGPALATPRPRRLPSTRVCTLSATTCCLEITAKATSYAPSCCTRGRATRRWRGTPRLPSRLHALASCSSSSPWSSSSATSPRGPRRGSGRSAGGTPASALTTPTPARRAMRSSTASSAWRGCPVWLPPLARTSTGCRSNIAIRRKIGADELRS
mmetsp:Transcript_14814/g.47396  ORF Transcript_14814/g.47396 Transcript_14814/m.47396 type:complete len:268 (+) Transcript_14814:135-938(+)